MTEEETNTLTLSFRFATSETSTETHEGQTRPPVASSDDDQEFYDAEQTEMRTPDVAEAQQTQLTSPDVATLPPQSTSTMRSGLHGDYEAQQNQVAANTPQATSNTSSDFHADNEAPQTEVTANEGVVSPPQSAAKTSSDLHVGCEVPQTEVTANEEVVSPSQSAANTSSDSHADNEAPQSQVTANMAANPNQSASITSSGSNRSRGLQSQQRRERYKQKMKLMNEGSREEEAGRQSQASAPSHERGVSENSETDAAIAETSRASTKAKSVPDEKRRLRNSAFLGSQAGRAHLRNSPGEVLLEPDLDCQPSDDFCADDMVGSAVKPVTLAEKVPRICAPQLVPTRNSTYYSKSACSVDTSMTPGAFSVPGRAFGAPRHRPFGDSQISNAPSERAGSRLPRLLSRQTSNASSERAGSRIPRVLSLSRAFGRNASTGTEVIAETVDAEAVVYASDVVKVRPKWVYYALGALAIATILALALGLGLTLSNDNNKENSNNDDLDRCRQTLADQDILDICFCRDDASLLSLSENETKFYDFASKELLQLGIANRTFERHDCANEHQVILSIANFMRLETDDNSGISLVVADSELVDDKEEIGVDFLIQQFILRLLYLETNGDEWSDNDGWRTSFFMCNWNGIKCNLNEQVLSIGLRNTGLNGTLPWQIGKMPHLRTLDLSYNPLLVGTLSPNLGNAEALHEIDMTMSGLSGTLPTELADLPWIDRLALAKTSIFGTIPTEYGRFQRMRDFNLGDNQLTGTLPSELGNMTNLEILILKNNSFVGPLPSELRNMTSTRVFNVGYNQLNGTLPTELSDLQVLDRLTLANNSFSGTFPTEFRRLQRMREFNADNNQLTGILPSAVGIMTNLEILTLINNDFEDDGMEDILENLIHLQDHDIFGSFFAEKNARAPLYFFPNQNSSKGWMSRTL
jgi:Leucine-rich repeat (LRR) protein